MERTSNACMQDSSRGFAGKDEACFVLIVELGLAMLVVIALASASSRQKQGVTMTTYHKSAATCIAHLVL
jgi:hypothetical protein